MSEKQETVSDIVAEMRRGTRLPGFWRSCDVNEILQYHADRLEAAWKREKTAIEANALAAGGIVEASRATAEKSSTVGDAAKLREALLRCDAIAQLPEVRNEQSIKDMRNIIRQAFSAPPRNCDVGTAEEQYERYRSQCRAQDCCDCPVRMKWDFGQTGRESCQSVWAQMPYESKEGSKE